MPFIAFAIVAKLGGWLLTGGSAPALYIARRRTSLPGLGLMLAAATGGFVLAVASTFLTPLIVRNFSPEESGHLIQMRTFVDFALYAVGLAGVLSLLRNLRRPKS